MVLYYIHIFKVKGWFRCRNCL